MSPYLRKEDKEERMKKATAIFLACLAAFSASQVMAGTVKITLGLHELRGGFEDGELIATPSGIPGVPDGVKFGTFCLEITEPVRIGGTFNADVSDAAIKGSTTTSDPLGAKTAWLYYQFVTGNIVLDTGAKATDFQYAIWKLEDEDTQAPSDWATIIWTAEAQAYYDMAMASTWQDIGPVRVLNLGEAPNYPDQDVLVTIPEPATIYLLGLGTLSLIRRKR